MKKKRYDVFIFFANDKKLKIKEFFDFYALTAYLKELFADGFVFNNVTINIFSEDVKNEK